MKPGSQGPVPEISNGDGLCFVDDTGRFKGFRVNRVGSNGLLYPPGKFPMKKIPLKKGMPVFRNFNHQFSRQMAGETSQRRIGLSLVLAETEAGVVLEGTDQDGGRARIHMDIAKEPARDSARAEAAIKKQLGKLGQTPFELTSLILPLNPLFFQAKILNQLRRDLVEKLTEERGRSYERKTAENRPGPVPYPHSELDYRGNVANKSAEQFYRKRAVKNVDPAFELAPPKGGMPVMTTRHCLRRSLGACPAKSGKKRPDWEGPFYLENNKDRFHILFDCKACEMIVRRGDIR